MIDIFAKTLEKVMPIASNEINEVAVYKDIKAGNSFVLIKLKDKDITKKILQMLYDQNGASLLPQELFVGSTVDKDDVLLLFNYIPERKLFSYLKSDSNSVKHTITVIKDLIFKFMSMRIAPPLIQLLIRKPNINLGKDARIHWGTLLDFGKINFATNEQECTKACLDLVNSMVLEFDVTCDKQYKNSKAIKLFLKKYKNNSYKSMIDVYNDFKADGSVKPHFYDNWYAAFLDPNKLIKLAKIALVTILLCLIFAGIYWLLQKSSFIIGLKNRSLNVIGTVDMTQEP
ncbi:MAG: hypothetical protein LBJ83_03065 [Oscillospiraceae bacterium]|jgi:hypothetical protein|nr:hypothetical protein [Oscillospiraceae bacterium]